MEQLYARKIGMMRIFTEAGEMVPVTVLEVPKHIVTQVKTKAKEGYNALQLGFVAQKTQRLNRAAMGHLRGAQRGAVRFLREVRLTGEAQHKVGDEITLQADTFTVGSRVDVSGVSIGKGFAGVMKRHGMHGFPMTRGTHEYRRHGGAIGCRKFPGRVFKNKRMPGQMGSRRVTHLSARVVQVRPEEGLLLIEGSVPGAKSSMVLVRRTVKKG